jgi:hypothetical protein
MGRVTQLELPLPKATAAERKAWIRDRLAGYEFRQKSREERRRATAGRRARRRSQTLPDAAEPRQLEIPRIHLLS